MSSINLDDFADGDTGYIATLNANNSALREALAADTPALVAPTITDLYYNADDTIHAAWAPVPGAAGYVITQQGGGTVFFGPVYTTQTSADLDLTFDVAFEIASATGPASDANRVLSARARIEPPRARNTFDPTALNYSGAPLTRVDFSADVPASWSAALYCHVAGIITYYNADFVDFTDDTGKSVVLAGANHASNPNFKSALVWFNLAGATTLTASAAMDTAAIVLRAVTSQGSLLSPVARVSVNDTPGDWFVTDAFDFVGRDNDLLVGFSAATPSGDIQNVYPSTYWNYAQIAAGNGDYAYAGIDGRHGAPEDADRVNPPDARLSAASPVIFYAVTLAHQNGHGYAPTPDWSPIESALSAAPGHALCVMRHGQIVHEQYTGLARRAVETTDPSTAVSAATLFPVMSLTKIVVAAMILRLHEAGYLDLDALAVPYLRGHNLVFDHGFFNVTIRDLLRMRVDITGDPQGRLTQETAALNTGYFEAGFDHPAGTWYEYRNASFHALALIAETIAPEGLVDHVAIEKRFVLTPLGLTDTVSNQLPTDQPVTLAYNSASGTGSTVGVNTSYAADLWMSARDAARLMDGLPGLFDDPATWRLMATDNLGLEERDGRYSVYKGHDGYHSDGIRTLTLRLAHGYSAALLVNYDQPLLYDVMIDAFDANSG